jgi:Flp pilus assembly protein TadG
MAAVELALLVPPLLLGFMGAIDYARVFYDSVTVANCARDGALYAADPTFAASTGYANVKQAALDDATDLSPTPTVVTPPVQGTDASGNKYVDVTVSYQFYTVASYPGIPSSITISRTARMPLAPP